VGVKAKEIPCKSGLGRYYFYVGRLKITLFAFNMYEDGSDRGGSIKDLSIQARRSPCESLFVRLYVDWTGDVMPCCNLRADIPEHKKYILGNVKNMSLVDIYFSQIANMMRTELAVVSEKTGVCRTCRFALMCSNKDAKDLLDSKMALLTGSSAVG
jgi:radical SAM protein with 4Fe4S-binding SPASM domain